MTDPELIQRAVEEALDKWNCDHVAFADHRDLCEWAATRAAELQREADAGLVRDRLKDGREVAEALELGDAKPATAFWAGLIEGIARAIRDGRTE